jgi:hypothetical protein
MNLKPLTYNELGDFRTATHQFGIHFAIFIL